MTLPSTTCRIAACATACLLLAGGGRHAFCQAAASTASPSRQIRYAGPIIDVHLHTDPPASAIGAPNPVAGAPPASSAAELLRAALQECEKYNIVRAEVNGWPGTLELWVRADSARFIPAPMILRDSPSPALEVRALRRQLLRGEAGAVGEILGQYVGLKPDDPALEPYWRLAEELDVPVMIHLGTSFPATAHSGYPAFRLSLGNPLLLEEALVRHPRLRVWVAHGGLPWSNEIFALMQQYPQLYIDIATINWMGGPAGRAAFHSFLQQAMNRGLGKRIMFGSDQMAWPDAIDLAIEGVDSADFLTPEQKRDIFYANAVRFLRLREELGQP